MPASSARAISIALTGLLVLLSIFAVGCRASLERMATREIEKRPASKVYLGGMKYFQDLMKQGQVPGVKSPDNVIQQPSDDLMTEEQMKEVKYPFWMTVKLKEKENENVVYSYTLLKQGPTVEWRIVEAWRGQIEIHNKVDLLQKSGDGASSVVNAFGQHKSPGGSWSIEVSASDKHLFVSRLGAVKSAVSSPTWTARPGWFAFFEGEERVWAYDGETDLFIVEKIDRPMGGSRIWGLSPYPWQPPDEVYGRLSEAARNLLKDKNEKRH